MKVKNDVKKIWLKILSLIMVNIIMITIFLPLISLSETEVKIAIESDSTQIKAGETVEVKIIVENDAIAGFSGFLDYDTSIFDSVTKSDFVLSDNLDSGEYGSWTVKYNTTTKKIMITEDSGDFYNIPGGVIATLQLEAIANADSSKVSFSTVEIDGSIDINGDGGYHEIDKIETEIPKAAESHTVTYDYTTNGGTSVSKSSDLKGENSEIDLTVTAEKEGWHFVGWNTNKDATDKIDSLNMGESDVKLYAIFSKKLTATCYYYDVSATKKTETVIGTMYNNDISVDINLPTITDEYMDNTGKLWIRDGWMVLNSNTGTSILKEGSSLEINSNIDCYMSYKRNINIRYHVNGGNSNTPNTQNAQIKTNASNINAIEGSSITITNEVPTRDGYTFKNKWNTTISGDGISYSNNTVHEFTDDVTLYAEWEANVNTAYKVEHYKQQADGTYLTTADEVENKEGITGAEVTAIAKTYDGYTYDSASSIVSGTIAGDGSLVLKLYYKANTDTAYKVEHYKQQADGIYLDTADETEELTGTTGTEVSAVAKIYEGYTEDTTNTNRVATGIILGDGSLVLKVYYKANTDTAYKVEHYKQQADGTYLDTADETEELAGTTGTEVSAVAKTYAGYTEDTTNTDRVVSGTITGDGSLVLKLYYKANVNTAYKVEHYKQQADGTYLDTADETEELTGTTGTEVSAVAKTYEGYAYDNENSTATGKIAGDGSLILKLYYKANTDTAYKVEHYKQQADGTYLDIADEVENKEGMTGAEVTAVAKVYDGYVEDTTNENRVASGRITEDGSLVLKIYYKNLYTITLDVNGGEPLQTNTIEKVYGDTYGDLPTPTRIGYKFLGWYDSQVDGNKVENTTIVTSTHTIYAHWEVAKYTVTLDVNGGDSLQSNTKEVVYGEIYGELPTPTKTGYTFTGWYDSQTGGNKIESTTTVTSTKNHVLYAQWQINKYTVEFIGKDANGQDVVIATVQIEHGNNITQNILSAQGINISDLQKDVNTQEYHYKYTGMETDKFYNVTEDRQIKILYDNVKNNYTITFYDEDKTTILGTARAEYGTNADDSYINPQKQDDQTNTYTFAGWIDEQGNSDDLSNVIGDRNVYATYTSTYKNYEVKFVDDNGEVIHIKSDYHYGDTIEVPENPTKESTQQYTYIFEGWVNSDNELIDISNMQVTENAIFTAKYEEEINKYTVTFYLDDQKQQKIGETTVEYGTDAVYNGEMPTKQEENGYEFTFDKWIDDQGNEDNLSNVIDNRDVIATFTRSAIVYNIEYIDTRGADNSNNPLTYTVEDADIILQKLSDVTGMKFVGWFSDETYTTEIESITTVNLGNIKVYAKWDIEKLMYFVKESAEISNEDSDTLVYENFDEAKIYVDNLFDKGNGEAKGIYDLNNDLVYYPEIELKLYYVKDNENIDNSQAIEYNDFDEAKAYVDELFRQGTTIRIYDQNNKLVYEPKEENPKVQYFVKVNKEDANTQENTFDNFNDAKSKADEIKSNGVKVYDINGDVVYEPGQLYLKSQKYKIGENNVDEYEENDIYLYRINPNTTLSEFISNCDTNGTISIYKKSGEKLGNDEVIGTGMTLKDELNGEIITLTLSVKGDIDGNGKVSTTDLSVMNQQILKEIMLESVEFMAADISDDKAITATDLSMINDVILKELDLSTIK